jgi:hypothetical protein
MNAALGFDSFVVMRHGLPQTASPTKNPASPLDIKQLGCYYCSDIMAARDVRAYLTRRRVLKLGSPSPTARWIRCAL